MPRNGDTEITRDPYCREHGHSRWQYKEGHSGDAFETELRAPEQSSARYHHGWEPVSYAPEPIPYTITFDHETRTIAIDNATWGAS